METVMIAGHVLLTLLWSFTAVCQVFHYDYDDYHDAITCDYVTGFVGKEVTLNCRYSQHRFDCCIIFYKYHQIYEDSIVCRDWFPRSSCEQRNSFTCSFTPTTANTEAFRFLLQTSCGAKTAEFTVSIKEPLFKQGTDPEIPSRTGLFEILSMTGVSCLIFIIFIIFIVCCVKRLKNTNPSGSQRRRERGVSGEHTVMTTGV